MEGILVEFGLNVSGAGDGPVGWLRLAVHKGTVGRLPFLLLSSFTLHHVEMEFHSLVLLVSLGVLLALSALHQIPR